MSETALELSRKAAEVLAARGIEQARLDAELLLAHALGVSRLQLYLQHDRPVTDEELVRFRAYVRRRLKREPVQYILGTTHFRELELAIDARVLIPRPETEELVGHVLDWAGARVGGRPAKGQRGVHLEWGSGGVGEWANPGRAASAGILRDSGAVSDGERAGRQEGETGGELTASGTSGAGQGTAAPDRETVEHPAAASEPGGGEGQEAEVADEHRPLSDSPTPPLSKPGARTLTALDIGTGSGAIALSLLKEGPFARVLATDASPEALEVARANARRLGLAERVEFRPGALWQAVAAEERFDVVASNPPYVAEAERAGLAPELAWEPAGALFAGPEGFDMLEPLVAGAAAHLRSGGLLALEIGATQGEGMRRRLAATGAFADVRVVRDLAGRDRIVLAGDSLAPEWKRGEHA